TSEEAIRKDGLFASGRKRQEAPCPGTGLFCFMLALNTTSARHLDTVNLAVFLHQDIANESLP
ncbi:hypothetical protein, partial [Kosakonia radicincitans]|uniref:hypothetical protein n=1 Tax=Kosakonia radicincitans TaxID=283686 RepID=UPI0008AD20D3